MISKINVYKKISLLIVLFVLPLIIFYLLFEREKERFVFADEPIDCKAIRIVAVIDESPSFENTKTDFLNNVKIDLLDPLITAGYEVDYTLFGASGVFLAQSNFTSRDDSEFTLDYDIYYPNVPCVESYCDELGENCIEEQGVDFGDGNIICARGPGEDWGVGAYKAVRDSSLWRHPDFDDKFYGKKILLALGDTLPIGNMPYGIDDPNDDLLFEYKDRIISVYNNLLQKAEDQEISFMGAYQAVSGEYTRKDTFGSLGLGSDDSNKYDILELMEKISSETNGTSINFGGNWTTLVNSIKTSVESYSCGLFCGDEIHSDGEQCDDVPGFVYTDNEDECPYGAENCCYTNNKMPESLRCTLYDGPYCGDGVPSSPFGNPYIDSEHGEECDAGTANGIPCDPTNPGTCRYCKADCTIGYVVEGADIPLVVTGGLVALDSDGADSAIELNRNLIFYSPTNGELYSGDNGSNVFNDNMSPSEAIFYDPRYLDIYRNILGSFGNIQFGESGVR